MWKCKLSQEKLIVYTDFAALILGVGQVGFWSSQAKSSIFENQNFKYLSSQILAKSSRVKY